MLQRLITIIILLIITTIIIIIVKETIQEHKFKVMHLSLQTRIYAIN